MADETETSSAPTKAQLPMWKNLGLRLVTGLSLAIFCVVPLYFGGAVWALLVGLLGLRMVREWVRMADPEPSALSYIIPMTGLVISISYIYYELFFAAVIAVIITGVIAYVERMRRGGGLWSGLGFAYLAVPCLFITELRGLEVGFGAPGFLLLMYLIAIVIAADSGAYLGGSLLKGPKMAPKLSPKKTWSGFFSGMTLGIIFGAGAAAIMSMNVMTGALLAIPVVILSVLGDFLESGLKRRLDVKDAGSLLPGHGGVLDRVDSLMLVMVVAGVTLLIHPGLWPF